MIHMPITVNRIGRVHNAFTETGRNRQIQNQLITPATAGRRTIASVSRKRKGPLSRGTTKGAERMVQALRWPLRLCSLSPSSFVPAGGLKGQCHRGAGAAVSQSPLARGF